MGQRSASQPAGFGSEWDTRYVTVKKPTVRETEKVGENNSSGATERHKSASSEGEGKEMMNYAKR